jgi:plastocyanin
VKGVRALASGMLVLALSCAIPAISAAQDAGTTTAASTTTATTTTTDPATPPPEVSGNDPESKPPKAPAAEPAPGTPTEPAPDGGRTADASVAGDRSPGGGSGGGARKSASASVSVGDNFYAPTSVTVAVGDTVTWNNNGQAPHSATANDGSFDTGVFDPGGSRSVTLDSPGTISYYCTVHGQAQSGTIRVLAASGGGGGGGGGGSAGSSASGSDTSEASAVASPDAAGDANTLPMTGMAVGGLAVVGFALLALGLLARQADPERSRRRWLPIF